MTNRLRAEIQEEELENEVVEVAPKKDIPDNWFTNFLRKGVITTDVATSALPFVLFLAGLGMVYIANMHMAEKNIRDIDKLDKEVKELSWDYKTTKAELAYRSTLTEVIKRADTLGLKEPIAPPVKLTVKAEEEQ
ncbi:FtsL-like putative cell division protein [Mucilaginibacter myungsuensis]|uniref:Cell division protein FtsL n=1 Tax=Mucilaginibacter myungsuensis TaxID=649104 RepID=A0A929PX07_9SPHI|nr:FtsL-like putative cell division protein [Mucilaginibacter myungsuensis]MBE9661732.1 hypothetical protein [Mucilaginibacter myungsuensis]MDN3599836.1 FtsL-like putative cell division protein [Mucilaginibacter myungsuensis]